MSEKEGERRPAFTETFVVGGVAESLSKAKSQAVTRPLMRRCLTDTLIASARLQTSPLPNF